MLEEQQDSGDRAEEIRTRIAELKKRWPAHSVPVHMWDELEELEDELERLNAGQTEARRAEDGRQDSSG